MKVSERSFCRVWRNKVCDKGSRGNCEEQPGVKIAWWLFSWQSPEYMAGVQWDTAAPAVGWWEARCSGRKKPVRGWENLWLDRESVCGQPLFLAQRMPPDCCADTGSGIHTGVSSCRLDWTLAKLAIGAGTVIPQQYLVPVHSGCSFCSLYWFAHRSKPGLCFICFSRGWIIWRARIQIQVSWFLQSLLGFTVLPLTVEGWMYEVPTPSGLS